MKRVESSEPHDHLNDEPTKKAKANEGDLSQMIRGGDVIDSAGIDLESQRIKSEHFNMYCPRSKPTEQARVLSDRAKLVLTNLVKADSLTTSPEKTIGILELAVQEYLSGIISNLHSLLRRDELPEGLHKEVSSHPAELLKGHVTHAPGAKQELTVFDILPLLQQYERVQLWDI